MPHAYNHSGALPLSVLHGQNSRGMQCFLSLFFSLSLNIGPRKRNYPERQSNLSPYPQWDTAHTVYLLPKSRYYLLVVKSGVMREEQMRTVTLSSDLTVLLSEHN